MIWGVGRWDVVQDESVASNCSFCGCKLDSRHLRYKCANCEDIKMCAGCYGQIHDVHPNHATLVLNESYVIPSLEDFGDEGPPSHGVKCINCSLDIVGARFHCAICENIDICSQCESAGLPGNLDSTDGGHISSHIMIKLGDLSRKARDRWTRDGISVGFHQKPIIGARYQCASCPSLPCGYSLCSDCEEKSYLVHDLIISSLNSPGQYSVPAGPPPGVIQANPKDYLENLKHSASICDRCMDYIEGVWFRCAYCPKDLCDRCAEVDSHDVNHIFLLFKSTDPDAPPIIPYAVYY
ncbi:hypothetical protein BD779DRAFT_1520821 [Infundibulicybe gibba]|nr:hypothetical protein BD779DRAFT_1520821 [Infundibulicybe gibba]